MARHCRPFVLAPALRLVSKQGFQVTCGRELACTDLTSKPWVEEAGIAVLNQPFVAKGNVATAGGCLSSQYLAAWFIARLESVEAARSAIHYVAPVGEKETYVTRAMANISPFL
ncbi:hypothetical protein LMG28614_03635 [Paraburkholderia ultramafica]|uniref:DJ-1/PfpI domain-containing protein n=1 Tax=Paraburkholderia ultramafica TaxID=1544867 RepID=A0A6S7BJ74_9BURK|nr:hypothetical protein LMG28614_03635 [Paraburkholderia ultramafica]